MSLDVQLNRKKWISYDECKTHTEENEEVFWANITHNLNKMADEAGIYEVLWRPEELGFTKASELVPLIEKGLADMKEKPDHYKKFDAENGWGTYKDFIPWIEKYLEACKKYPNSTVSVSR